MKMSREAYADLKSDISTFLKAKSLGPSVMHSREGMWEVFHRVCFQRGSDDTHPIFAREPAYRILPFKARGYWLDRLYRDEDLNDDHIETALRKIHNDLTKE